MKLISKFGLCALTIIAMSSCCNNSCNKQNFSIKYIAKDTTVFLNPADTLSPRCEIELYLPYAVGDSAANVNKALLADGMLTYDTISIKDGEDMGADADKFIEGIIAKYKEDCATLYAEYDGFASLNYGFYIKADTVIVSDKIVAVVIDKDIYTGGAHGENLCIADNFCTRTGEKISLADIEEKHGKEQLEAAVKESLLTQFGAESMEELAGKGIFWNDGFYLPKNFILDNDSVTFIYESGEIAAYAAGEIRVAASTVK